MRERIGKEISDYIVKEISFPEMQGMYLDGYAELVYLNKAHTVMLVQEGIIDAKVGATILTGINEMRETFRYEDLNPKQEDIYFCFEQNLLDRIGRDVGGRMHTGRSRNDLYACLQRMIIRKSIWEVLAAVIDTQELLLNISKENIHTIITGYTHWQPAQPITLAHYFSAYINVLQRDFARIQLAYEMTNECPLGGAAFAGTGFPINRQTVADLLGFDRILANSLDCIAARDFILQAEMAYASMMTELNRVAHDMYIWATDEFRLLELGGEVAFTSSIMPQKKNPNSIENIIGRASSALGAAVMTSNVLSNTPFNYSSAFGGVTLFYNQACTNTIQALGLMQETWRYSHINQERALARAKENFSTVTALADDLVRFFDLPFRDAHAIVGRMVYLVKENNQGLEAMDSALLKKVSQEVIGRELIMTAAELAQSLDPLGNVQSKQTVGGPSPESVQALLTDAQARITAEKKWLRDAKEQVTAAYAETDRIAQNCIDRTK